MLVSVGVVLLFCIFHSPVLTRMGLTGGDNSNKRCFGTKPKLFRESGDFSGNRDTWTFFRETRDNSGTMQKKNRDIRECIPKIREDDPNFRDDLS